MLNFLYFRIVKVRSCRKWIFLKQFCAFNLFYKIISYHIWWTFFWYVCIVFKSEILKSLSLKDFFLVKPVLTSLKMEQFFSSTIGLDSNPITPKVIIVFINRFVKQRPSCTIEIKVIHKQNYEWNTDDIILLAIWEAVNDSTRMIR